MARFLRYTVHQRVDGESGHVGLFTAAYHLRRSDDLTTSDRDRLETLLDWFVSELPVPPRDLIPRRALFWYQNAAPFSKRMWELAQILDEYHFTASLILVRSVGKVIYRDSHQCAAIPFRRPHR